MDTRKKVAIAIVAVLSISVILFIVFQYSPFFTSTAEPESSPDGTPDIPYVLPDATEPESSPSETPSTPDVSPDANGSNSGSETSIHEELVNYALTLINNDRQLNGLENVTLSNVNSGQVHADNMLENNFAGHWDLNGYKPHMRYTLAGGKGAVSENVAWMYSSGLIDPKETLEELQRQMMYDDAASGWGHKNNILTPFHNKVSIGIAYNDNYVYFVQDFENDYVAWETLTVSNNEVTMKGTILRQGLSIKHVAVYYDNPESLTVEQLMNPPFQGGYDLGTFVGMALPSGRQATAGITIPAQVWTQTGQNFEIKFTLSTAQSSYGKGIYTLCLQTDLANTPTENNYLTTYSFWYDG
jgi:uncharacterized protein YkwD